MTNNRSYSVLAFISIAASACSTSSDGSSHNGATGGTSAGATGGATAGAAAVVTSQIGGNSNSSGTRTGGTAGTNVAMSTVVGGAQHPTNGGAATGGADQNSTTDGTTTGGAGQNSTTGGAVAAAGRGGASAVATTGGKSNVGGSSSATTNTAGNSAAGASSAAEPSAQDLLNQVSACSATATAIKGGFGLDGGSGNISMYQCGSAVYWKADMDVDCDGIQTPPCDTDVQGQPQTSIVDDAPNGDVDPTKLPYIVIPLGSPETTWYKQFGIELGQVGAVIYKGAVQYGIFADEAGGAFIGEASYAMCQLFLGKPTGSSDPCDPNQGGIDPADVTYVTFTGTANRATGNDIYSHDKHTAIGIAAAKAWIAQ